MEDNLQWIKRCRGCWKEGKEDYTMIKKLMDGFFISPTVSFSLRHNCSRMDADGRGEAYSGIPMSINAVQCNWCGTEISPKVRVMHKLWELTK